MKQILLILFIITTLSVSSQEKLGFEGVLQKVTALSTKLPASITEAYEQYNRGSKKDFDSLQQLIDGAYPALAEKAKRRSLMLNALVGINEPDAVRFLVPASQGMADYFMRQWDRFDALERSFNSEVKSFFGKEEYKKQGYIGAWDSVYRVRKPSLLRYRDGVLKLVNEELVFLKKNRSMLQSTNEAERIQFIEAEVKVLQQLNYLKEKLRKVVVVDGVEKVEFCYAHPDTCQK